MPVFSQQMSWNGSARTTLSASGNKSREVLPKQERDEYSYRQAIGGQMRGFGQKQKAMEDRLSYAEINIDEDKAQIQLITGRVDEAEGRISAAEITLNGADGQIGLVGRVETAEGDIKSAAVKIDGLNSTISLKADATVTDALGERVSSAEISIDGLNSEIELKADKITLKGYVTADQLSAELADFKLTMNQTIVTNFLGVNNKAVINSMTLGSKPISLESLDVATGRSTGTVVYVSQINLNSDGTVKSVKGDSKTFVTGLSYSTIQYLKWS